MKKIVLLLIIIVFAGNCAFANDFTNDVRTFTGDVKKGTTKFFDKLKTKPSAQERLAPIKNAEDVEMTPSEQAIVLYNENNIKASLQVLMSIKESERSAQDWLLIGNILQDQQKVVDASFMYKRAIIVNPKFYKAYYNLANIYLDDDKPYLAIESYRKANKLNPEFAYGYYNLGCAYVKAGDLKKAKIAFLKAIELKNTEPDFYYNLAYAYKKLKKDKLAKQYLDIYNKIMANNQ